MKATLLTASAPTSRAFKRTQINLCGSPLRIELLKAIVGFVSLWVITAVGEPREDVAKVQFPPELRKAMEQYECVRVAITNYQDAILRANEAITKQNKDVMAANQEIIRLTKSLRIKELQSQAALAANRATNAAVRGNEWRRAEFPDGGDYPAPPYPKEALSKRLEGTVTVSILVAENGQPGEVAIMESSGQAALDHQTMGWIKTNWRWPAGDKRRYFFDCDYRLK